ncbi:unnamed protein product, partial [Iphiclides podalirius]
MQSNEEASQCGDNRVPFSEGHCCRVAINCPIPRPPPPSLAPQLQAPRDTGDIIHFRPFTPPEWKAAKTNLYFHPALSYLDLYIDENKDYEPLCRSHEQLVQDARGAEYREGTKRSRRSGEAREVKRPSPCPIAAAAPQHSADARHSALVGTNPEQPDKSLKMY